MFTHRGSPERRFFSGEGAALPVLLSLNILGMIFLLYQGRRWFRAQSQTTILKKKWALASRHCPSVPPPDEKSKDIECQRNKLVNGLSFPEEARPDIPSEMAQFLPSFESYPEDLKLVFQKYAGFLWEHLRKIKFLHIETISLSNFGEEKGLMPLVERISHEKHVKGGLITLKIRTTLREFNRFLSSLSRAEIPLWIQELRTECPSLEEGLWPHFVVVLEGYASVPQT
ncbi:MAG: hypothetical protein LBR62_01180 [Puniceicoccales bacterium]|jgi:hypothetical protein|nr:hypothetical protein [Puniceicoccales bacterium]